MAVSPTITDGPVTITTTANVMEEALPWTLADAQGRVMAIGRITESVTPLYISGAPGIYLLFVTTADGPVTFTIVKK